MQNTSERSAKTFSSINHFEIANLPAVLKSESEGVSKLHSANHYEIICLKKGTGSLTVNLQQHTLTADRIYFISPGQLRAITLNDSAAGFYISVAPDFLNVTDNQLSFICMLQQFKGLGNALVMEIEPGSIQEIEYSIARMKKELESVHPLQLEILQSLFRTFLLYLSKGYPVSREVDTRCNETRIVKTFMQLVNNQFIHKKMVTDYASELCVTRSYLNKVVKKVSGFTASQIIQQCVIQEAKKQAIRSGNSMKQIAYSLGFENSAHFSKFFKTNCGINFTNYKKEIVSFQ